ncbi:hypothetical protein [Mitsuokella multacida]|uniref:hypothetical protein n=1 Tax=Mitsuokella multacida TaxID=52226 RepID=UPI003FF06C06
MKHLIIIRGGGELGSGIAHCLHRAGFRVLILEQKKPAIEPRAWKRRRSASRRGRS